MIHGLAEAAWPMRDRTGIQITLLGAAWTKFWQTNTGASNWAGLRAVINPGFA